MNLLERLQFWHKPRGERFDPNLQLARAWKQRIVERIEYLEAQLRVMAR